jgi:hypothetical protein
LSVADAEEYRRFAQECARVARESGDPQARALFISMARNWMLLAEQAAKTASGAYHPSPPSDDPDTHRNGS